MFPKIFLIRESKIKTLLRNASHLSEHADDLGGSHETDEDHDEVTGRKVFLPMLMLLGILYCRSNKKQRAQKFFELLDTLGMEALKDN